MPRIAVVDNDKLKNIEEKKIIISKCPVNKSGAECMSLDSNNKLLIDELLCTGCSICTKFVRNEEIKIINLPDSNQKNVIHQYGENGFRIFDLPQIHKNSIVGIMGRNGIGKSTVINILSNVLKANFGEFDKKLDEKEYFENFNLKFRGSALQNFFNELKNNQIKVSYKAQKIIDIPKIFNGKVIELLKKITPDENKINEFSKKFMIENILQRDIKVLSGGELQRVAILASLLKNSNFFIFDEITNYLDIYQRLNTSKIIKEETKNSSVMIVEHDLVVLDYLCDYINIMYGEPSAYGMISNILSSKEGINTYLKGFISSDNVKFRDREISFDKLSVLEDFKSEDLITWQDEKISFKDFELEIKKGSLQKSEILGIVGENALGKSTFIEHISKKDFEGKNISYKKQLIETDDELVISHLCQSKNFNDTFYKVYIFEPLKINNILEKKVSNLSGGELQRFAIVKCLLEDSDIYLLDEPTAFLDIEDRLNLSKVLKNFISMKKKSAIIIDHDLVFMDYLSNKMMVFLGEPSKKGLALTPTNLENAMNTFLEKLEITFRKDDKNKRPRVNQNGSVLDQKQKKEKKYYYN